MNIDNHPIPIEIFCSFLASKLNSATQDEITEVNVWQQESEENQLAIKKLAEHFEKEKIIYNDSPGRKNLI